MYKSKEIRWFSNTLDTGISNWFQNHGYTFENANSRTDYYLLLKNEKETGIKLREGNVELKKRISRSSIQQVTNDVEGIYEDYIKWSFTTTEKESFLEQVILKEQYNWLAVQKDRMGYKLTENPNGSIIKVKIDEYPAFGCQVEYTRLKIKDEVWYTLAMEWFGEKLLKFDLKIIKQMLEFNKLKASNSMGYAAFLNRFYITE